MFLMFHLERPDVLPVGDLGIRRAIERAYGLAATARGRRDGTDRRAVASAPHARVPLPVALAAERAGLDEARGRARAHGPRPPATALFELQRVGLAGLRDAAVHLRLVALVLLLAGRDGFDLLARGGFALRALLLVLQLLAFREQLRSSVCFFFLTFGPQTALSPLPIELTSFAFVVSEMNAPFCPTISVGRF